MVSTSTKADVMIATAMHRSRNGRVFVFDPTGTVAIPWWVTRLQWSPVLGCDSFDRAVAMAHSLASAARPVSAESDSAHWVERAEALLAPLLFAAATRHLDMDALCRWVLSRELEEPIAVIAATGHDLAAAVLAGVAATDERERSGIFSTTSSLLSAYRSESVLASARHPNFDPRRFAASSDSLFICAPAQLQDQLAPLVIALLEQIRGAVLTRPPDAAPLLFALDEVANIAPLPALPALAAEGGGQGLVTLACLQDLSQARVRWGAAAEGFFTLFGTKVVLPGVADQRTLQLISALAGDVPVQMPSYTKNTLAETLLTGQVRSSVTKSYTWRPRLPLDAISRGTPGRALVITGSAMSDVGLLPWWQHSYWSQLAGPSAVANWDQMCQLSPG
jgi:type IV secretory pathway TraG/TraD family ATPase VirD4